MAGTQGTFKGVTRARTGRRDSCGDGLEHEADRATEIFSCLAVDMAGALV